ncbi:MAG: twin-arginine translocase TatA/TatE family subunit [Prochlorotrichaceae cyanobacterium]|jgi:sec-independent protein translocase protein TatA
MFNLGWLEVGLILLLAIIVFGPKKIPELGAAFGKTLRGFKEELKEELKENDTDGEDDRSSMS